VAVVDDGRRDRQILDELVGLIVDRLALRRVERGITLVQEFDYLLVRASVNQGGAPEEDIKEAGGIGKVSHPAQQAEVVLAMPGLVQIGGLVIGHDLGFDAHCRQVGLYGLTHLVRCGIVATGDEHHPPYFSKLAGLWRPKAVKAIFCRKATSGWYRTNFSM